MKAPASLRTAACVMREVGESLRSGRFRLALVLSALAHAVLLVALSWSGAIRGEARIPAMRVHLVRVAAGPDAGAGGPSAELAGPPSSAGPATVAAPLEPAGGR